MMSEKTGVYVYTCIQLSHPQHCVTSTYRRLQKALLVAIPQHVRYYNIIVKGLHLGLVYITVLYSLDDMALGLHSSVCLSHVSC